MSQFEKKNQFVSSVDEYLGNAVKNKIFHLNTNGEELDGRSIVINGNQKVINFGSCSYLGLEMDDRLKEGSIEAIRKYGTQFSSSRAFLSCGQYEELESLHSQMFDAHCIVSPTTTLGHIAAIPTLVADNDAIILDHQVHGSVQNAVQLLKPKGVRVEMIRHNNLQALEDNIKALRDKHYRIWYMADGVYSMYGDYAPIKELYALMDKYAQLHLYIDDAHGMSWTGKNGTGYITSQVALRPKVYLSTSMAKGYGSGGGILIFKDEDDKRKVRTVGSSFVFSGPIQPAVMGANIASAKIHLSEDIYRLQHELKEKIAYTDKLILEKKLPYVFSSGSPIFYIGLGIPAMGYNIVQKLIQEGFYVDIGIFPGVPLKRTGLRLAINNNLSFTDIKNVIDAIEYNFPKALFEEQQTIGEIGKHFRMDFSYAEHLNPVKEVVKQSLQLKHYNTIHEVDKSIWDSLLGDRGSFDWEGCRFLENVFVDNPEPENNWKFHYYFVYENDKPILATFVTELICKDDMLSPDSISRQIELDRKSDPYFLTSKVMMMGCLLTEGEHLYLNKKSDQWKQAVDLLIKAIQFQQQKCEASAIYLRDIANEDDILNAYLMEKGFIKSQMPDSWVVENSTFKTEDEEYFLKTLSKKTRAHWKKEILNYSPYYEINFLNSANDEEIDAWYNLYLNVKNSNAKLNTFNLPKKIVLEMSKDKRWDIMELRIKNNDEVFKSIPAAIAFMYKGLGGYCPIFLGLDYSLQQGYNVYRQVLFQALKRANELKYDTIFFGMEAGVEKRKIGAIEKKRSVFMQFNDNFIMSKLSDYSTNSSSLKSLLSI